jgi:hypothetical protein
MTCILYAVQASQAASDAAECKPSPGGSVLQRSCRSRSDGMLLPVDWLMHVLTQQVQDCAVCWMPQCLFVCAFRNGTNVWSCWGQSVGGMRLSR